MGDKGLNPGEELEEIFSQLKGLMAYNRDLGLEAPALGRPARDYLDRNPGGESCLEDLRADIGDCTRCRLSRSRTRLIFGEGSPRARLVFVGEAPGRDEDLAGRPFVGEAGKLLTRIIEKGMHLSRDEVYICNVVKCRPPRNRDPEKDEIETCLPFLKRQLRLIRPEVICTLGRIAAKSLLGRDVKITEERGSWQSFMGIPVMPTFHPAYILRNPAREKELKGHVWEDIQNIMRLLRMEVK